MAKYKILTPTNDCDWHMTREKRGTYILPEDCKFGDRFNICGIFTIKQNDNQQIKIGSVPDCDDQGHEIYELYNREIWNEFSTDNQSDYCIREIKYEEYSLPDFKYFKDDEYYLEVKLKSIFTTVGKRGYIKSKHIQDAVSLICVRSGCDFIAMNTMGEIIVK